MQTISQTNSVTASSIISGNYVEFKYEFLDNQLPTSVGFRVMIGKPTDAGYTGNARIIGNYDAATSRTNSTSITYEDGDGSLIDAVIAECKTVTNPE